MCKSQSSPKANHNTRSFVGIRAGYTGVAHVLKTLEAGRVVLGQCPPRQILVGHRKAGVSKLPRRHDMTRVEDRARAGGKRTHVVVCLV